MNNNRIVIDLDINTADNVGATIAIPQKDIIIAYLRNGAVEAAAAGRAKDVLTGERIPGEWVTLTDGIYEWDTSLIYHFDKYNIRLPDEFIRHILNTVQTEGKSSISLALTS